MNTITLTPRIEARIDEIIAANTIGGRRVKRLEHVGRVFVVVVMDYPVENTYHGKICAIWGPDPWLSERNWECFDVVPEWAMKHFPTANDFSPEDIEQAYDFVENL